MRFDETPAGGGGGGWEPPKKNRSVPFFLRPSFYMSFGEGVIAGFILLPILVLAILEDKIHPRPYKEHRKVL